MLKCVSRYRSSAGEFVPGDVIEDPKLEAVLLADSPASFQPVEPEPVAPPPAPPAVELRGPGRRYTK